ncbi:head decoration protein [Candidatus Nitrosopumilus sediminis]|nr:head decoration protein [Candidatus Nitrosopumilus sediminis]
MAYADPQITIDEAVAQTDPPFTINDSASTVLFRILSDGQVIIDQFLQLSGAGLTQVRTYVFPDSSGTVVLEDTSQTLTSKNIDADSNTITNIDDSEIKTGANIALSKLATDPLARASHTGTQTASTISDFDNQVILSRLDQMTSPTSDVSLNNQKITNLADPTASTDAATKNYVDATSQGLDIKQSVRVATTTAGTFASDFENGDTIDGVVLATGNRILIKNQASGEENGIYTINVSGAPTRATDADVSAEVTPGMFCFVREGTVNADFGFVLATDDPITLDTTPLVFTQFSGVPIGETNTSSNTLADDATRFGLANAKSGVDLPFKVLKEGSNIDLTTDADQVIVTVTGAELSVNKNAASGYAGLDGSSRIDKAQSPSDTVYTDDGQTLTTKTIDADSNTLTNIDNNEIKSNAGIDWTKISKTGSSVHDIANVTNVGCAAGQVLKASAGSWICANDVEGVTSINGDASAAQVFSGTSGNVTITDTGAGTLQFNTGHNIVTTGDSAQTITKSLTLDSAILGGNLNANSFTINNWNVATITGTATLTTNNEVVLLNPSTTAFTVNLPDATGNTGKHYRFHYVSTTGTPVTIDGESSDTINGALTIKMKNPYAILDMYSDGTNWVAVYNDLIYGRENNVIISDDFLSGPGTATGIGAQSTLRWTSAGVGTETGLFIDGELDHLGIKRLGTGATSGNDHDFFLGSTPTLNNFDADNPFDLTFIVRPTTAISTVTYRVGANLNTVSASELTSENAMFLFDTTGSSTGADTTHWVCRTRSSGGTDQTTATSSTVTLNQWYNLRILKDGGTIRFLINDVNVCNHSAQIPTSALSPFVTIDTFAGSARSMDIDYFKGSWIMSGR